MQEPPRLFSEAPAFSGNQNEPRMVRNRLRACSIHEQQHIGGRGERCPQTKDAELTQSSVPSV